MDMSFKLTGLLNCKKKMKMFIIFELLAKLEVQFPPCNVFVKENVIIMKYKFNQGE